jgi:hypothetical protein
MQIASTIVKIVHDMTRDALTQLAGTAISAATTAAITIGFGTPWAVAQVATRVSALSTRIGKYVTKLIKAIKELLPRLEDAARLFRSLRKTLDEALESSHTAIRSAVRKGDDAATALPSGNRFGPMDARGLPVDVRDRVHTNLTNTELDNYLKANTSPEQYDQFLTDGHWPDDVPIPADRSFVNANGEVDWSGVPHQGFGLDPAGNPITKPTIPQPGEVFDRHGSGDGRFTSPVDNGTPYSYDQRSLPWAEDPPSYHQYVVERPFNEIGSAIDELPPGPFRDYIEKAFAKSSGSTSAQTGPIAPGFGHAGGGVQTLLPLTVNELCALGVIREVVP